MINKITFDFDDDIQPMDIDDLDEEHRFRDEEHDYRDKVKKKQYQTRPVMTKYEYCDIIGARATLLAKGAPPCIDTQGEIDPTKVAKMELLGKKIPVVIRRYLPNDEYEDWALADLDIEAFKI